MRAFVGAVRSKIYPQIPKTTDEGYTQAKVRRAITNTLVAATVFDCALEAYKGYKLAKDPSYRQAKRQYLDALDKLYKTNAYARRWFW